MPVTVKLSVVGVVCLTFIAGCGRGDGFTRVKVRGEIQHKGEPVMDGQIRFYPEIGTRSPVTIELVMGGKYKCNRKGGLPIGTHRVVILSFDPDSPIPKGPQDPPRPQWLPPKYNDRSELTMTVEKQRGWATRDFDLKE
jgi:hypothetical protein